jgi:hypothetical protein
MVDQKMLLNLLLLVLTSVAAVGGSVNVMENYEEHPEEHPDPEEEEKEKFYQYVKEQENFQNASMNANVTNTNASMNANVAPQVNTSNVVAESFQAEVGPNAPQVNANATNTSNAATVEGFTGGSFAAF